MQLETAANHRLDDLIDDHDCGGDDNLNPAGHRLADYRVSASWQRSQMPDHSGSMRTLVHALKFHDRHDVRRLLGRWLVEAGRELVADAEIVVPVPLARRRLLARRFNQAAVLAREVARLTGLGYEPLLLERTRSTESQVGLSRGQRQRAAIARAVVHEPALLVADEPTGNLDSENGARVLALLSELNRDLGLTILLATHSDETASVAHRTILMRDGQIAGVREYSHDSQG